MPVPMDSVDTAPALRRTQWLALGTGTLMVGALIYGSRTGDFFSDGAALLQNPWGVVTLVEVYIGYVLFSAWIIQRERSMLTAGFWVLALMVIGHLVSAIYIIKATHQARGRLAYFWSGQP